MNTDCLNIVMATDSNYLEFVATCICSLMENNRSFESVRLFLLENGINEDNLVKFQRSIERYDKLSTSIIDVSNLKEMLGVDVPNTIALTAYARLFIELLLPEEIDKALYLDCDIIVNSDLLEMFDTDMSQSVYGVLDILPDSQSKIAIGNDSDSIYINSGVLLINLKRWREHNFHKRFLDFLMERGGVVHHHDQGIINAVCCGDTGLLHPKFNVHSSYFSHPYSLIKRTNHPFYSEGEYKEARQNPVIVHYTTGYFNRPWIENSKHPLKYLFERFHRMTEWKNTPKRRDDRSFTVRVISWVFLNLPLFCYTSIIALIGVAKRLLKR